MTASVLPAFSSDALLALPPGSALQQWARSLRGSERRAVVDAAQAVAHGSPSRRLQEAAQVILTAVEA